MAELRSRSVGLGRSSDPPNGAALLRLLPALRRAIANRPDFGLSADSAPPTTHLTKFVDCADYECIHVGQHINPER
eukprot:4425267-Prymnesium_polylepis.2